MQRIDDVKRLGPAPNRCQPDGRRADPDLRAADAFDGRFRLDDDAILAAGRVGSGSVVVRVLGGPAVTVPTGRILLVYSLREPNMWRVEGRWRHGLHERSVGRARAAEAFVDVLEVVSRNFYVLQADRLWEHGRRHSLGNRADGNPTIFAYLEDWWMDLGSGLWRAPDDRRFGLGSSPWMDPPS